MGVVVSPVVGLGIVGSVSVVSVVSVVSPEIVVVGMPV